MDQKPATVWTKGTEAERQLLCRSVQMVEQPQGDSPLSTARSGEGRVGGERNGGLNSTGSSSSGLPPPASSHPLRKQERFFPAFPDRVCSCNLQTRGPAPVCTVPMDGNQGPAWVSRQASLLLELGKPVGNWTRPTWGKRTKTRLPVSFRVAKDSSSRSPQIFP